MAGEDNETTAFPSRNLRDPLSCDVCVCVCFVVYGLIWDF